MKLELPWPPSLNHYYGMRKAHRFCQRYISTRGKDYRQAVMEALQDVTETLSERLMVKVTLHGPNKRKYDIDNHAKALLDALTHAEIWDDDELIDLLIIERGEIIKGGKVVVEIAPYQDAADRWIEPFKEE